jgi:hypothetical protein
MDEVKIRCMKCKKDQPAKNVKELITANGRRRLAGVCAVCGTKVSVFAKSKK